MASHVLPQAFFMVPTSSTHSASKKLSFTASVSRRRCFTASGLSCNSTKFDFGQRGRNGFVVVRAEANAEVAVEESLTTAEEVEEEAVEEVLVEEKAFVQPRTKLGDVMGILNKRAIDASDSERPIPDLRTGDIVEIKLEVPENRRRLSIYKGIIISKQNAGIHTTIRIRRIIAGVGVEIVFPIYSPNVKEIKVLKHRKVRRARLYYLRDKLPRLSTFK